MSRRRKRLGSDLSRATELMSRAERITANANADLREDNCGGALDNIFDAAVLLGTAEASIPVGSRHDGRELVDSLVELNGDLADTRETFLEKCMCTRSPSARPLSFRRRR